MTEVSKGENASGDVGSWPTPIASNLESRTRMKATKQLGEGGEVHFQSNGAKQVYWLRKSSRDL